jgi:hypothetical protein
MICQKVCAVQVLSLLTVPFTNSPLGAFYMVGDIDAARAKGEKILAEL